MVSLIGNSPERVVISDPKDVIYYRQVKEYTDQEFDSSRDLKREVEKGHLLVLERSNNIRQGMNVLRASPIQVVQKEPVNNAQEIARELAPLIAGIVRQELSSYRPAAVEVKPIEAPRTSSFEDTVYTPTVTTEGMEGNIAGQKQEVSGAGTNDALAALRKLKK